MSDAPSGSGKHRRTGSASWRQKPLLSKLNQRIGSITSKIPRPHASSKSLKRSEESVKSKVSEELPPYQKVPAPLSQKSVDVLATLDEGYFSPDFDPLSHELKSLPSNVGQEELDSVVDKLASALEVVSAQLSTHVLENHDSFVQGISTVASVESDLQQAHIVTCNARVNLRFALDEVKTNMRIAKQTQQKQGYMGILEQLSKLQHTQRLKQTLKEAQESGEYAEAFMRCAECFDHLESLGDVTVAVDLNKTVNTLCEETVMRVENALQAVCMDFRPDEYKRVLQGFMFQNITNQEVSAKVLHAFQDSIIMNSRKVVRSLIVTKPNLAEELLSGRGEAKFTDMCQALPFDLLRPCLAKMLEVLYDAMCSYQNMAKWHEMMLKQMASEIASARGSVSEGTDMQGEDSPGRTTPKDIDDDSGMVEVMGSVHDTLVSSRKVVWDAAARKVRDLLSGPAAFEGDHFLQVMEWCQRFLSAGEAFIQEESEVLRSTITIQCGKFFETYHQTNLEAMEILLKSEQFVNISSHFDGTGFRSDLSLSEGVASGNMANMSLRDVLNSPSVFEIYPEDDFDASDFESWVDRGNPFRPEGSPRKRRKKDKRGLMLGFGGATNMGEDGASQRLDVDEHGVTRGDNVWSRQSTESFPSFSLSRKGTGDEEYDEEEEAPELFGEVIDEDTQMVRMGESSAEPGQTSGDGGVVLTNSAHQMLKWMKNYGSLMRPLSSRSEDIFNGMCHLFDTYLLEVFLFVSGLSLESVIWEEDLMTTRLKSTLIRILTSDWSPYKEEVERIRAAKPVAKSAAGLQQKESKLTKDFKSLFQRGDKGNPTAQVNANGTSSGVTSGGDATPTHVHSGGAWERPAIKSSGNMYGLKETVVAIASIETLAQQLTESRSVLQTLLPPTASRTIDAYYRTVDSTEDLKEVGFRNAARRMLHEMLDPEKGIASQIVATQYDGEEISVSHNPWAHVLGENVSRFAELLGYANLPDDAVAQMWDHAMKAAGEVMLDGFSGVEKCSMGGRSMMSLDLTYVENIFKLLLPESTAVNLRIVDTYIKAYYYAWEEIPTWAETHHVEYGPSKIAALVEHIAQRVKSLEGKEIKRSEIRQMKNRIEERMTQLMG
ncbi:hypothetical protein BSKO_08145 [Bryopsis sp. KO-2023]|nr:hypothetical protein BSKO_08145 [Bryopsis sp. KO-2023]